MKKSVKRGLRVLRARSSRASHARRACAQSCSLFSASFQTFCLTARAYLNMQKYGLFCSLNTKLWQILIEVWNFCARLSCRRHFAGKPSVALQNVVCFLRLELTFTLINTVLSLFDFLGEVKSLT